MEIDLTDDDMIITGALTSKAPVSKPKKPPEPSKPTSQMDSILISSESDEDDVSLQTRQTHQAKSNKSNKTPPVKETVKRTFSQPTPVARKVSTSKTNLGTDDDDIIEVVDSPEKASKNTKSQTSPKTTSRGTVSGVAKAIASKPKTSTAQEDMEVDDVIEVVQPLYTGLPPRPHHWKWKPRKNLQTTVPRRPSTQSKEDTDDIIEVTDTPPNVSAPKQSTFPQASRCNSYNVVPVVPEDVPKRKDSVITEQSSSNQRNKNEESVGPTKQSRTVPGERYVVDITDEKDTQHKRKAENKCLNVRCTSGEGLAKAPMFVVSYYGCKLKKAKHEVCEACFNEAVNHHEGLALSLVSLKPLLAYENFPLNDIPMVDLESDEEPSDTEDPLPFSLLQDVDENLEEVLEESFEKYAFDFQIREATKLLATKMTSLELNSEKIDARYDEIQKEIDEMRRLVYKPHEPIIKELPSLDIPFEGPAPSRCQPLLVGGRPISSIPIRGVAMKRVTQMSPYRHPLSRVDESCQDVVALNEVNMPETPLPPIGNLMRPKPRANDPVYVMKMSFFGVWLKGHVIEVINTTADGAPIANTLYKVKMDIQGNRKLSIKTVPGRHLAYPNPAAVRLEVGTRVIAVFQDGEPNNQNKGGSYYSGLIAEPPKSNNRYRYLVFFDDGYAQYVPHNKILVVCETSTNVWDDMHPDSRDFIEKYLKSYPERPMVKLAPNQVVKTEWNGKWWIARVVQVDGSLVKMSFDADKRTEWIYRGSTRLAPLYTQLANQQARQESGGTGTISRMRGLGMQRVNQPYVEYTQNVGTEDEVSETPVPAPSKIVRAVAKKSTTKKHEIPVSPIPRPRPNFFNPDNIGSVKELQLPKDAPMPKRFQAHGCGPNCIEWIKYDPIKMRGYNPLSIPLYCGWQRELPKFKKNKHVILYTAPCGRRLRNMQELHRYLRICKSNMSVDLFDFDFWVNALSEFTLSDKVKRYIVQEDISHGKENVKIPLVNYVDHSLPNNLIYANERQAYEGVPLNTDSAFLCGCDCTDDCQNKAKCACWQLTIQGSAMLPGGYADPNVGYYYKRLQERVITGIYECNEQCKCSKKTCLNRVVQHPLQLQLQLFKTPNKGWGLRCVNDIPKGTFICIYAGYLYTEQTANFIGEQDGDDYLAELDYIEVVERMKEDYESDVEEETAEEEKTPPKSGRDTETESKRSSSNRNKEESDADFKIGWKSSSDNNSDDTIRSRLRKRTAADLELGDKGSKRKDGDGDDDGSDDDKLERQPSSFTPKPLKKLPHVPEEPVHRFQSVRKFYGPNERVYIMDANKVGNIGRYLNHSCSPNVFVQNVFVDTHDLRFPWVAFFALSYIRAGTELTWDYNYDVGSVPDKQIICQCGSSECRGRLL